MPDLIGMLSRADVVAFTHTGFKPADGVPFLDGFECVVCSPRVLQAPWGGVAVYARSGLGISLALDLPEFGQAWVRVHAKTGVAMMHACVCYLPPVASSYFKEEDGVLSAEMHYQKLREMVTKFRAAGEVLIMGDLNARTGSKDDRCDQSFFREWEALEAAGISAPGDLVQEGVWSSRVGGRASCDKGRTNGHGGFLLDLCRDQGLLVLNGRLPGDVEGAYTYYQHGNPEGHSSVIDYFVASPGLAFLSSGEAKPGTSLRVWEVGSRLVGPGGKSFDHLPVFLEVVWDAGSAGRQKGMGGRSGSRYKWKAEHREYYCAVLSEDTEVTQNLEAMRECEGIDDADAFFSRALVCAINRLQEGRRGVIVSSGPRACPKSRPCNPWFGAECKAARRVFCEAVRGEGAASSVGRQAYREYKKVTQQARRAWESKRDAKVLHDVRCNPKVFWDAFGRQSKKEGGFPLAEWSKYFKELFQANSGAEACAETGGGTGLEPDGACPVLFPPADADLLKQAADLNRDFSVSEITQALRSAANGKSAGVDGLPMEFMKHAVREVEVEGKTVRVNILAGHITHLFNRVLEGGYPKGWAVGAIVPVPKPKGDPARMDDYRGIAVGGALSKLFSLTLLRRMDEWAE